MEVSHRATASALIYHATVGRRELNALSRLHQQALSAADRERIEAAAKETARIASAADLHGLPTNVVKQPVPVTAAQAEATRMPNPNSVSNAVKQPTAHAVTVGSPPEASCAWCNGVEGLALDHASNKWYCGSCWSYYCTNPVTNPPTEDPMEATMDAMYEFDVLLGDSNATSTDLQDAAERAHVLTEQLRKDVHMELADQMQKLAQDLEAKIFGADPDDEIRKFIENDRKKTREAPTRKPRTIELSAILADAFAEARIVVKADQRMAVNPEQAEAALIRDIGEIGSRLEAGKVDSDVQMIIFPPSLIHYPEFSFFLHNRTMFFEKPMCAPNGVHCCNLIVWIQESSCDNRITAAIPVHSSAGTALPKRNFGAAANRNVSGENRRAASRGSSGGQSRCQTSDRASESSRCRPIDVSPSVQPGGRCDGASTVDQDRGSRGCQCYAREDGVSFWVCAFSRVI